MDVEIFDFINVQFTYNVILRKELLRMYKIVAIDLDGTLLNSYGEISDENKLALNLAKEKGIEIVLASGRTTSSVKAISEEIGIRQIYYMSEMVRLYMI